MNKPLYEQIEITVKQAKIRSMTRAGKAALRSVQNLIMKHYNIKLGDLNDRRTIRAMTRYTKKDVFFVISMSKLSLPAALFKPVQTFKSSTRKKAVSGVGSKRTLKESGVQKRLRDSVDRTTVEFIHGKRRPLISPGGNKPFIARMESGHIGVFYRISAKRLKIQEYGMGSVAGLVTSNIGMAELTSTFHDRYEKELEKYLKESGNA